MYCKLGRGLILNPTPRGHNSIRTAPDVLMPGCESLYLTAIANSIAKFDPPSHRNYNQNQPRLAVELSLLILETRLVSSSFLSSPRPSLLPPALQSTSQCCSAHSASQCSSVLFRSSGVRESAYSGYCEAHPRLAHTCSRRSRTSIHNP
jgi:hypothetical protein